MTIKPRRPNHLIALTSLAAMAFGRMASAQKPEPQPDFWYRPPVARSTEKLPIHAEKLNEKHKPTLDFLAQFDPDFYVFSDIKIEKDTPPYPPVRAHLARVFQNKDDVDTIAKAIGALVISKKIDGHLFTNLLAQDVNDYNGEATTILGLIILHGDSADPDLQKQFLLHLATHYDEKEFQVVMAEVLRIKKQCEEIKKSRLAASAAPAMDLKVPE